jgi:hypothetical protein
VIVASAKTGEVTYSKMRDDLPNDPRVVTGLKEENMANSDIALTVLFVGSFSLLGGVLGWASWEQSCADRKAAKILKEGRPK